MEKRNMQKLLGFALIVISFIIPIIDEFNDATAAAFTLPLGIYLLLTKEDVLDI